MTPPPRAALVVAIVGAESTGKTALAEGLQRVLSAEGLRVARVTEALREFCDQAGRTPMPHEQRDIAQTQTRRIAEAAKHHELVIADTTAVMTAVYSDFVFGDTTLYAEAEADHRACTLTLLTALDLPWVADGLQRDGPQVRAPVDALVRAALQRLGAAHAVIGGLGPARLEAALAAVRRAWQLHRDGPPDVRGPRWQAQCERCGDPACERHALWAGG